MTTDATAQVAMRRGTLTAVVRGGPVLEIASLTDRGEELLVPGADLPAAAAVHGEHGGISFLHPWANRLGANDYRLDGRTGAVPLGTAGVTRDAYGRAIHGLAAPDAGWSLSCDDEGPVTARLAHDGADGSPFPFPHEAEASVTLTAEGLRVSVRLTATTDQAVPVAVGWHPYLRLPATPRAAWRLGAPARRRLTATPDGLPDGGERPEPCAASALGSRTFDDGYRTGTTSSWTLGDDRRTLRIRLTDGYPVTQLFAPSEVDVVSIEPMTAATDALRDGDGLAWARPGAPFVATFALDVEPRGAPGYRCPG